jgi:hypothetical protein
MWVGHFLAEIVAEKSDLMSAFLIGIAGPHNKSLVEVATAWRCWIASQTPRFLSVHWLEL